MANEEQLSILKQGVRAWNEWRDKNHDVEVDLKGANLGRQASMVFRLFRANSSEVELRDIAFHQNALLGTKLSGANLSRADLSGANLRGTDLNGSNLSRADLREVNFGRAILSGANLSEANLSGVDLSRVDLFEADLRRASLVQSNLSNCFLYEVNLSGADLKESNFSNATMAHAIFGDLDLRQVKGLDKVKHLSPSTIGTNTITISESKIPEVFLRGCGLSDWEIEAAKLYNPELTNDQRNKILYKIYDLQTSQAIQISPVFISYSHLDYELVDKLGNCLQNKGIRYWRDIHDMRAGRMEKQIERAIRQNPTVLLVLSKHSILSDWVEHEVRTARGLEKEMGRDVLCPVALDDSWKSSRWPKRVMEQIMEYNILDFSAWEDDVKFAGMFLKLIDGLELFYKG